MIKLKKFAQKHLQSEIEIILQSERNNALPELTLEEKAIIYKYTDDGHFVNESLYESKGTKVSEYAKYLDYCLSKLPNFEGITFRGSDLESFEIEKYQKALDEKMTITEHGFISASRIKKQANQYRRTALFEIFSKNGKLIEKVSKFVNEQEVIFRKNSKFRVLGIEKIDSYVYITLREI